MSDKLPRLTSLAMLKEDWIRYCEEHGHPPTWSPHEKEHKVVNNEVRKRNGEFQRKQR